MSLRSRRLSHLTQKPNVSASHTLHNLIIVPWVDPTSVLSCY
jgi:hypothetical protein